MRFLTALSVAVLVTCVTAQVIKVPLTKLQRDSTYFQGLSNADRARSALLMSRANGEVVNNTIPATNVGQYVVYIGIGKPPTNYRVIVDTGSSNTFCGTGGLAYKKTSASIPTGKNVTVHYSGGSHFTGLEYLDQVTVAPGLVIQNQSIGDALSWTSFVGVDGILGLGPADLTKGTLAQNKSEMIPTVMNNLASQGLITRQVFGIYFAPTLSDSDENGALTFGGIEPSLYNDQLAFTPLTDAYPSAYYWGINIACTYGNETIIPSSRAGIVDTGTVLILIADDYFEVYMNAIPGASIDEHMGLISFPNSSVQHMHPLTFMIGTTPLKLEVAAQLIPERDSAEWGITGRRYGIVFKTGYPSAQGWNFVLGEKFLERFYSIYDADAGQVGFAATKYTSSTE